MYIEANFQGITDKLQTDKIYTSRYYKSINYEAPCSEISERNYFCHLSTAKK